MDEELLSLDEILKAGTGATSATDVALNGTLSAKQGRAFANAIVDNSGLLKEITVDITGKLTKDRTALSSNKGLLTRHISGTPLTEAQWKKLGTIGASLDMTKGVSLQFVITDEALDDNQDNPQFEDGQYTAATTTFSNDLVYLGWVGTADNPASDAPFNELARGWLTVAAEDSGTVKATYPAGATAGETVEAALQKVCDSAHEDITDDIAIYCSKTDYSTYVRMIAKDYRSVATLKSGEFLEFEGRPLKPQKGIPQGVYLGSPVKNLVMGFSKAIDRKRWYDPDRSSLIYKFVTRPDYEFDIKQYVTIATQA